MQTQEEDRVTGRNSFSRKYFVINFQTTKSTKGRGRPFVLFVVKNAYRWLKSPDENEVHNQHDYNSGHTENDQKPAAFCGVLFGLLLFGNFLLC